MKHENLCGTNTFSRERIRELLEGIQDYGTWVEGLMAGGFAKTRSVALSWLVCDIMAYCRQEGLSFDGIMKQAKKQMDWQVSRECSKCKAKISPDDHLEGHGVCACCSQKEVA